MSFKLLSLLLAASTLTAACSDDDNTAPVGGESRVRVVHASPDAPGVDVLVDDAVVLSNVPYLGVSAYLDVPSGGRNLKVNAAGTASTVIDADADLADGSDYTVIAASSRESSLRFIRGSPYSGSRTLSMTWMTPLVAGMSAWMTVAFPTVTFPPVVAMVSSLPFTVLADFSVATCSEPTFPGTT